MMRTIILALTAFSLSACLGAGKSGPNPEFAPVLASKTVVEWKHNGAIF